MEMVETCCQASKLVKALGVCFTHVGIRCSYVSFNLIYMSLFTEMTSLC